MWKLLIAIVIGVVAWQAWGSYQARTANEQLLDRRRSPATPQFGGDLRTEFDRPAAHGLVADA